MDFSDVGGDYEWFKPQATDSSSDWSSYSGNQDWADKSGGSFDWFGTSDAGTSAMSDYGVKSASDFLGTLGESMWGVGKSISSAYTNSSDSTKGLINSMLAVGASAALQSRARDQDREAEKNLRQADRDAINKNRAAGLDKIVVGRAKG